MGDRPDRKDARQSETQARIAEFKYGLYLMRQNPLVLAGSILVVFIIILSATATWIVDPEKAYIFDFSRSYCWSNPIISWGPQGAPCPAGTNYLLGTDGFGRDLLSMMILAIPLDITIAFVIVAAATAFGVAVGAIAGWVEESSTRLFSGLQTFSLPFRGWCWL